MYDHQKQKGKEVNARTMLLSGICLCVLSGTTVFFGSCLPSPKTKSAPAAKSKGDHLVSEKISEAEFNAAIKSGNVVVKFHASWCPPCRAMEPVDEQLAAEYKDKITFIEVDTGKVPSLAQKYGVRGIPTYLFFKDGEKIGSWVGLKSKESCKSLIDGAFK